MRLLLSIIILVSVPALSQELVPNGSFEQYDRCPGDYIQSPSEFHVQHWFSASAGTPDYFNACSAGEADVPHNWAGVADPFEGKGYAGLYVWMDTYSDYREYLQVKLTEPLVKDTAYIITFQYKLSSYSKYAIDRLGFHLCDSIVKINHDRVIRTTPTFSFVKDSALTQETGLWEMLQFTHRAKGGEQFLIIGNFSDDKSTHFYKIQFRPAAQPMLTRSAYYYVDNVSIVPKHVRDAAVLTQMIAEFDLNDTQPNTTYVLRNINFQFNSFRLVPPSFAELDKVADFLLKNPRLRVQLFGHTDDQGTEGYNVKLSQARAKNVSEYLSSVGVRSERIEYFGYGKSRPLMEGTSEQARSINRRVEIRFIQP